jgi:hypothetical protein
MTSDLASPFEVFKHAPMGMSIFDPTDDRITYYTDEYIYK